MEFFNRKINEFKIRRRAENESQEPIADENSNPEQVENRKTAAAEKSGRVIVTSHIGGDTIKPHQQLIFDKYKSIDRTLAKNGQYRYYGVDKNGKKTRVTNNAALEELPKHYGVYDDEQGPGTNKPWNELSHAEKTLVLNNMAEARKAEPTRREKFKNIINRLGVSALGLADEDSESKHGRRMKRREEKSEDDRNRRKIIAAGLVGALIGAGLTAAGFLGYNATQDDDNGRDQPGQEQPNNNGSENGPNGQDDNEDQPDSPAQNGNGGQDDEPKDKRQVERYNFASEGVRLKMIDRDGDGEPDRAVATLTSPGNVHGNLWNASQAVLDTVDGSKRQPSLREIDTLKDQQLELTKWDEESSHHMPVGTKFVFEINGKKVTAKGSR